MRRYCGRPVTGSLVWGRAMTAFMAGFEAKSNPKYETVIGVVRVESALACRFSADVVCVSVDRDVAMYGLAWSSIASVAVITTVGSSMSLVPVTSGAAMDTSDPPNTVGSCMSLTAVSSGARIVAFETMSTDGSSMSDVAARVGASMLALTPI